jgi:hypothetical protein
MRNKFYVLILLAALFAGSVSGCDSPREQARISADHHQTGYVPWGIDEFELFGLTKQELDEKFKGELHVQVEDSAAVWNDDRPGRFHLAFDKDDNVTTVQRVFIDGAGCEIRGPRLTSKKEALRFSVDGLSNLDHLDQEEQSKLATAQALLKDLSK